MPRQDRVNLAGLSYVCWFLLVRAHLDHLGLVMPDRCLNEPPIAALLAFEMKLPIEMKPSLFVSMYLARLSMAY